MRTTYGRWMWQTALIVAALVMGVSQAQGAFTRIELGELQALPGQVPPFGFQLPLVRQSHALTAIPAIVVQRPSDVLFFVKQGLLELRLLELADVELEISYAGQTMNRLLLKTELQAARARMHAAMAWDRYQAAKAKGIKDARLGRLLEEAYRTQQTWARLDPTAAQPQLPRVLQERLRVQEERPGRQEAARGEEPPPRSGTGQPPALESRMAALERELGSIREAIHGLAQQVRTHLDESLKPVGEHPREQPAANSVLTVALGGLLLAGVASLLTGYSMQRRVVRRGRPRRRLRPPTLQRARGALSAETAEVPAVQPLLSGAAVHEGEPHPRRAIVRRVRVSHRTSRRVRISREQSQAMQAYGQGQLLPQAPAAARQKSSDLTTALAILEQELRTLQGRSHAQPTHREHIQALLARLAELAQRM